MPPPVIPNLSPSAAMDNLAVLIDFAFGLQPVFKFVAGFSASRLIKFILRAARAHPDWDDFRPEPVGVLCFRFSFSFLSFCCCYFFRG